MYISLEIAFGTAAFDARLPEPLYTGIRLAVPMQISLVQMPHLISLYTRPYVHLTDIFLQSSNSIARQHHSQFGFVNRPRVPQ